MIQWSLPMGWDFADPGSTPLSRSPSWLRAGTRTDREPGCGRRVGERREDDELKIRVLAAQRAAPDQLSAD